MRKHIIFLIGSSALVIYGCGHLASDEASVNYVRVNVKSDVSKVIQIDSKSIEGFVFDLGNLDRLNQLPGIIRVFPDYDVAFYYKGVEYSVSVSPILTLSDKNTARQIIYNGIPYLVDIEWNKSLIEIIARE